MAELPVLLRSLADAEEKLEQAEREHSYQRERVRKLREEVVTAMSSLETIEPSSRLLLLPPPTKLNGGSPQFMSVKARLFKEIKKARGGALIENLRPSIPQENRTNIGPAIASLKAEGSIRKIAGRWAAI